MTHFDLIWREKGVGVGGIVHPIITKFDIIYNFRNICLRRVLSTNITRLTLSQGNLSSQIPELM